MGVTIVTRAKQLCLLLHQLLPTLPSTPTLSPQASPSNLIGSDDEEPLQSPDYILPGPLEIHIQPASRFPQNEDEREPRDDAEMLRMRREMMRTTRSRRITTRLPADFIPLLLYLPRGEEPGELENLVTVYKDLVSLLEDAQDGRSRISQHKRVEREHAAGLSQATHQELQTYRDHVYVHETHIQAHQAQLQLQRMDRRSYRLMRNMRREMEDMQAELLAHREQQRRARQLGGEDRIPNHQDATEDADNHIYGLVSVLILQGEIQKLEIELWNLKVKGNDVPSYTQRFQELTLICTKFCANETKKINKYIRGLPDNNYGNVKSSKPKTLDETIELANDLMDQKLRTYAEKI
ncbi:hypothetical protein Tco_0873664 [Tanacetum coccineum]|uniref:Reverse transcriptase domain-containing protein n=1 Tax=Tanacetum coccineum TaxID=301880 RepID=A0ABQ5BN10_9ASTR